MAQSTTTLLQAANAVLLDIGERPVTTFGSNIGLKVKNALISSTYDLCSLEDWNFMITTENADAWAGNKATLLNRRRLYRVFYRPASGQPAQPIRFEMPVYFERRTITSYSTSGSYPLTYTTGDELSCYLNPYPATSDEQVKIWFVTAEVVAPPTSVNQTFPVPERFLECIKKRALYYMALRHLDDTAAASMYNGEYEMLAQRFRDTEKSHETGSLNMFTRR